MTPKVSVVVPFFNAKRYLGRALKSVCNQTLGDFECLCADDGSTDGADAIVEDIVRTDPRFRLIRCPHRGAGHARNAALDIANGEFLAFLDADDYYEPNFLEEMVSVLVSPGAVDLVVCAVTMFCDETGFREPSPAHLEVDNFKAGDLLNFTSGNPWNKVYRRDFIERHHLRFMELPHSEDVAFVFPALALARHVAICDKALTNYCLDNADSLEHTKCQKGGPLVFYDAYLEVQRRLRHHGVYERVRESYIKRMGRALRYNIGAPETLADLRLVVDHIRIHAQSDFGLLKDVPTVFDEELRDIVHAGDFDAYVVNRLRFRRGIPLVNFRRLSMKLACKAREVEELHKSLAYRVGMVVTAPVRAIKRAVVKKRGMR